MQKIYDRQFSGSYVPKRLHENLWFKKYQHSLLWLANTDIGRDFLCIDKSFPQITRIAKNFVQAEYLPGKYITDFRVGAKWANIIRFKWDEFCDHMAYAPDIQYSLALDKVPVLSKGLRGTTTTVYPDPDPETTTVDGRCFNTTSRTFTNQRNAASSDGTADNEATAALTLLRTDGGSSYSRFQRAIYLFDTSAIGTDEISSATISFYVTATSNTFTLTAAESDTEVVSSAPASDTAIATGDFDSLGAVSFGTLAFASISTSAYNDITLNGSGQSNINKSGVSDFGVKMGCDLDNDEPASQASKAFEVTAAYAEQTGTANDPKLVVIHAPAAGATFTPKSIFI